MSKEYTDIALARIERNFKYFLAFKTLLSVIGLVLLLLDRADANMKRFFTLIFILAVEFILFCINKRLKYTLAYTTPFLPLIYVSSFYWIDAYDYGDTETKEDLVIYISTMVRANE